MSNNRFETSVAQAQQQGISTEVIEHAIARAIMNDPAHKVVVDEIAREQQSFENTEDKARQLEAQAGKFTKKQPAAPSSSSLSAFFKGIFCCACCCSSTCCRRGKESLDEELLNNEHNAPARQSIN